MQKNEKRKPLALSEKFVETVIFLGFGVLIAIFLHVGYWYEALISWQERQEQLEQKVLSVESDIKKKQILGYELVWNDEFDGDSLDKTKWEYHYGTGFQRELNGWSDFKLEYNTDRKENVRVEDGKLIITAIKEKKPYQEKEYTSGCIKTVDNNGEPLFSTTFGRIEARIKMPEGAGLWSAFWMRPEDERIYGELEEPAEIDIAESIDGTARMSTGIMRYGDWKHKFFEGAQYFFPKDENRMDFHTYALEWTPDEMKWYVDNRCFQVVDSWEDEADVDPLGYVKPAPFDVPFYIVLNLGVVDAFDRKVDFSNTKFPASMEVDYVRVYQKKDGY